MTYQQDLIRVMKDVIYCGVAIKKSKGQFETLGSKFNSLEQAKEYIDKSFWGLQKSIKKNHQ